MSDSNKPAATNPVPLESFSSPLSPPPLSFSSPIPSRIVSKKAAEAAEATGGHADVDRVGEPYLVATWDGAHLASSPVASLKRESDGAPVRLPIAVIFLANRHLRSMPCCTTSITSLNWKPRFGLCQKPNSPSLSLHLRDLGQITRPRFDFQVEAEVRGTATSADAELVIEVRDRSRAVAAADAAAADASPAAAAEAEAEGGGVGERVGLVRFTRDDLELRCRHDDTAEPHEISPWQVRVMCGVSGPGGARFRPSRSLRLCAFAVCTPALLYVRVSCLMPHASYLVPHVSCLMPCTSCLMLNPSTIKVMPLQHLDEWPLRWTGGSLRVAFGGTGNNSNVHMTIMVDYGRLTPTVLV